AYGAGGADPRSDCRQCSAPGGRSDPAATGRGDEAFDMRTRFHHVLLTHLRQVKGGLFLATLCTVGVSAAGLLKPWPLKIILDHVILGKPLPRSSGFLPIILSDGATPRL